jgi:hypothetical protein
MKISTVREFRDHASRLMRDDQPLLVTRRGRLAGVYFPWTESALPVDLKKELFRVLTNDIAKQARRARIDEAEVQKDFAAWRSKRRAAGRGR